VNVAWVDRLLRGRDSHRFSSDPLVVYTPLEVQGSEVSGERISYLQGDPVWHSQGTSFIVPRIRVKLK
jgi:hypothetical protein